MKKAFKRIKDPAEIKAFYEATNSLHDGEVAFADLGGDTLRVAVDITSIEGCPRVEMIFRGVKAWQIANKGYIFCSNIAFEDGGIIWADACRFDSEVLEDSHYVRAASMEWVM